MSIHDHDFTETNMLTVCETLVKWDTISVGANLEFLDPKNPRAWLNIEGNAGNYMSKEHLRISYAENNKDYVVYSYPEFLTYLSTLSTGVTGKVSLIAEYNKASFLPIQNEGDLKFLSFKGSKGLVDIFSYQVDTIMHLSFEDCSNLISILTPLPMPISSIKKLAKGCTSLIGDMDLTTVDIRGTDASYAFSGCEKLSGESITFSHNLDQAKDITGIFEKCKNFTGVGLAITTPTTDEEVQLEKMGYAFSECGSLDFTELFPHLNFTKVVDAPYAFFSTNLTPPSTIASARYTLNGFDNLVDGEYLFCNSAIGFDTEQVFPNVQKVQSMFRGVAIGIFRNPLQLGKGVKVINEMFQSFFGYFRFSDTTDFSEVEEAFSAFSARAIPESAIPDVNTPLTLGDLSYTGAWSERVDVNLPDFPSLIDASYMFANSTINQHLTTQFMGSKLEKLDGFRSLPYATPDGENIPLWMSQEINISPFAKIKSAEGMVRGLSWGGAGNIAHWNVTEAENLFQMLAEGLDTSLIPYNFPVDISGWCVPNLQQQFILIPSTNEPHWGEKCCC